MDNANAMFFRLASSGELNGLVLHADLSLEVRVDSGEDLHQRAFSSTVFTADRVELSAPHIKRHILQRDHAGEAFGDLPDVDEQGVRHEG